MSAGTCPRWSCDREGGVAWKDCSLKRCVKWKVSERLAEEEGWRILIYLGGGFECRKISTVGQTAQKREDRRKVWLDV